MGKRAWNSGFTGGMGKRAWNSGFTGGLGKRAWNSGFTGLKECEKNIFLHLIQVAWADNSCFMKR